MTRNGEEKRCPLCAEEMDWTDQQFMPCKCGYQICVWCWHHVIDMAEKDRTEGRCPACRTIYEKEKIVATQTNCERTMRKISSRKAKPPPKTTPKANEVKKDLTNIRVMQRKMVYVIGLPLSLAHEDILVRKEYFGQYGKVTKVSLSRTIGGAIQQFANDTCSVYITYSKEEETLQCIQSVHGFVLEGRFLRASFGTAKYCHAWLKNTPCNNHACLYLHNIGADEDSFGIDEVAAVHTRGRVQQIVGSANNIVKRSGDMLPPPVDSICNSSNTISDKATLRGGTSDATHSSANIPLTPKEKGANAISHKTTTFVDVVGRPNCAAPEKDVYFSEDRRISNLSSEFSLVTIDGDNQAGEPYTFPTTFKMSCTNNHTRNNLDDPSFLSSDDQGSNDSQCRAFLSASGLTVDSSDPANSHDNDAPLPIRCINSLPSNTCQEIKFQNSAKSDRIYKSSNSFSNEEIVEHLRRIDGGADTNNDKENPVLDAVESSIISNIMSIGLDSFEDSLAMRKGLSDFLDETDGLDGSSWSSINSDQSGHLLVKQGGYANQMTGPALPEFGDIKEQYSCNPQYPVHRSQSLFPPGFSVPSRDPPPGFSTSGRTSSLSRDSSGIGLTNGSSFLNTYLQPSSTRLDGSVDDSIDFFDPSLLNISKGSRTNGLKRPSFETRPTSNQQLSPFDLLLMQQSASAHQDSRFSQFPTSQQESSYTSYMGNNGNYDHQPFFTQMSQQSYGYGHMSNNNGYMHSVNEVQQQRNCEVGLTEHQRNERLEVDYFPGYGNSMFNSSDVYTRVFGS